MYTDPKDRRFPESKAIEVYFPFGAKEKGVGV